MTTPDTLKALRWAAGAPEDMAGIGSLDVQDLLRLFSVHHLYARFVARVGQEHPRWASRALSMGAWQHLNFARRTLQRQADAVREICLALGPEAVPPVIIKGISVYALTGKSRNVRVGGDVDLLTDDPERLWAAMAGLGYALKRDTDDHGAEYAVVTRSGLEVEIHRYFPAWAYPLGLADAELRPAQNPDVWVQPFADVRLTKIGLPDLVDDVGTSEVPQTQGLAVPGPTATALLLCAHVFRHYAEGRPLPTPVVRLGELADVHDLAGHAHFNQERFRGLMSRLHAEDAVRFVRSLSLLWLASDPFPWLDTEYVSLEPGATLPFPMQLSPWSGWGALLTPDELLRPLDPRAMFDRLGPNAVLVDAGWYGTPDCGQDTTDAGPLSRVVVQSPRRERMPLRLSVASEANALRLDLHIHIPLSPDCRYQVMLYDPCRWDAGVPPGTLPASIRWAEAGYDRPEYTQSDGTDNVASMRLNGDGGEAKFTLPWAALPPEFAATGSFSLMAVVMRLRDSQSPNVRFREDVLMLVPLYIQRAGGIKPPAWQNNRPSDGGLLRPKDARSFLPGVLHPRHGG